MHFPSSPSVFLLISACSQSTYLEPFDLLTSKRFSEGSLSPNRQGSNDPIIRNRQRTRAPLISQRVKTISLLRRFFKNICQSSITTVPANPGERRKRIFLSSSQQFSCEWQQKENAIPTASDVISHSIFTASYKRYYRCLASAIKHCFGH